MKDIVTPPVLTIFVSEWLQQFGPSVSLSACLSLSGDVSSAGQTTDDEDNMLNQYWMFLLVLGNNNPLLSPVFSVQFVNKIIGHHWPGEANIPLKKSPILENLLKIKWWIVLLPHLLSPLHHINLFLGQKWCLMRNMKKMFMSWSEFCVMQLREVLLNCIYLLV